MHTRARQTATSLRGTMPPTDQRALRLWRATQVVVAISAVILPGVALIAVAGFEWKPVGAPARYSLIAMLGTPLLSAVLGFVGCVVELIRWDRQGPGGRIDWRSMARGGGGLVAGLLGVVLACVAAMWNL